MADRERRPSFAGEDQQRRLSNASQARPQRRLSNANDPLHTRRDIAGPLSEFMDQGRVFEQVVMRLCDAVDGVNGRVDNVSRSVEKLSVTLPPERVDNLEVKLYTVAHNVQGFRDEVHDVHRELLRERQAMIDLSQGLTSVQAEVEAERAQLEELAEHEREAAARRDRVRALGLLPGGGGKLLGRRSARRAFRVSSAALRRWRLAVVVVQAAVRLRLRRRPAPEERPRGAMAAVLESMQGAQQLAGLVAAMQATQDQQAEEIRELKAMVVALGGTVRATTTRLDKAAAPAPAAARSPPPAAAAAAPAPAPAPAPRVDTTRPAPAQLPQEPGTPVAIQQPKQQSPQQQATRLRLERSSPGSGSQRELLLGSPRSAVGAVVPRSITAKEVSDFDDAVRAVIQQREREQADFAARAVAKQLADFAETLQFNRQAVSDSGALEVARAVFELEEAIAAVVDAAAARKLEKRAAELVFPVMHKAHALLDANEREFARRQEAAAEEGTQALVRAPLDDLKAGYDQEERLLARLEGVLRGVETVLKPHVNTSLLMARFDALRGLSAHFDSFHRANTRKLDLIGRLVTTKADSTRTDEQLKDKADLAAVKNMVARLEAQIHESGGVAGGGDGPGGRRRRSSNQQADGADGGAALTEADKQRLERLGRGLTDALQQFEALREQVESKAAAEETEAALRNLNNQVRRIASGVTTAQRDFVLNAVRNKVDRDELSRVRSQMLSASLDDSDESAVLAARIAFRCLSCNRPLSGLGESLVGNEGLPHSHVHAPTPYMPKVYNREIRKPERESPPPHPLDDASPSPRQRPQSALPTTTPASAATHSPGGAATPERRDAALVSRYPRLMPASAQHVKMRPKSAAGGGVALRR